MARDSTKYEFDLPLMSQCAYCQHALPSGGCLAYYDGIPEVFLTNELDHRIPSEGDRGFIFTPREDASSEALKQLYAVLDRLHE